MKRSASILIFADVEVMDFAGPFEVFSVTNELNGYGLFDIRVVAKEKRPVLAKNGLSINPDCAINEIEETDILIIPGGSGTRKVLLDETLIDWVRHMGKAAELTLSVCSGSLILASCGLLEGLKATTHHQVTERLAAMAPGTEIIEGVRFVDNGSLITSAGISAGIDMSLHVIGRLFGEETRLATARYMEYPAGRQPV